MPSLSVKDIYKIISGGGAPALVESLCEVHAECIDEEATRLCLIEVLREAIYKERKGFLSSYLMVASAIPNHKRLGRAFYSAVLDLDMNWDSDLIPDLEVYIAVYLKEATGGGALYINIPSLECSTDGSRVYFCFENVGVCCNIQES